MKDKFLFKFTFLDYANKDKLILPVPPSDVRISYGKMVETINLLRLGEVDFHIGTKLTEITFSTFLPKHYDPAYCCYTNIPDPQEALEKILKWISLKQPVTFIISNTPVNDVFNILNIDYSYSGGSIGDIDIELHLRRHKSVEVYKVGESRTTLQSATNQKRIDTKATAKVKKYTVKKGDNLSTIAQKLYGDSRKWQDIYNANKKIIGNNPTKLREGMELIIP